MTDYIELVATKLPELIAILDRDESGQALAAVETAIKDVTGAATVEEAAAKLADPGNLIQIKSRVAQIALAVARPAAGVSAQDATAETAGKAAPAKKDADASGQDASAPAAARRRRVDSDPQYNVIQLKNTEDARKTLREIIKLHGASSMTASIISIMVVCAFFAVLYMVLNPGSGKPLSETVEPDALQVINILLGTLATGFATVLNFWLGSSLGSQRKDATAAQADAVEQLQTLQDPKAPAPTAGGAKGPVVDAGAPDASRPPAHDTKHPTEHGPTDKRAGPPPVDVPEDGTGKDLPADEATQHLEKMSERPKPVPAAKPVPPAHSSTPIDKRFWPVKTSLPQARVVSFESAKGEFVGRQSRCFTADRNPGRFHCGVDLFATRGDRVFACEDGKIVAFQRFYRSKAGDMSFALLIEHADFVINYGEVAATSMSEFQWEVGSRVQAGQPIASISGTDMLHFETYVLGTRQTSPWFHGQPQPPSLLNPTSYLLELSILPER